MKETFYKWITNPDNKQDCILFSKYFDLSKLPNKVCSSKFLHKILIPSNTLECNVLNKTFSNYFKYHLLQVQLQDTGVVTLT